jgi:hypothetical protein
VVRFSLQLSYPPFQIAIGRPTHRSGYWSASIIGLEEVRGSSSSLERKLFVSSFDKDATKLIYRWNKIIISINNLYSAFQEVVLLKAYVEIFCFIT